MSDTSDSSPQTSAPRDSGLDVLRGALLTAMLGVHVTAAHASPTQAHALHAHFGIFLISSGFVALSGYAAALTTRRYSRRLSGALRLVLVMVGWGVLLSLVKHALLHRAEGCAPGAWLPPSRFETLGILLAIAAVQLLAPLARLRAPVRDVVCVGLAALITLLPGADATLPSAGALRTVFNALTQRSLTPYYTLSTFIALGLVGAWFAGRSDKPAGPRPGWLRMAYALSAFVLSLPWCSRALLDSAHALGGGIVGGLSTLAYWSVVLALLIAAARGARSVAPGLGPFALLGRHSLLTFVVHLLLLELDAAAQSRLSLPRSLVTAGALFASNFALLWLLSWAADNRPRVAAGLRTVFLFGSQDKGWVARLALALTIAAVVAAYSGPAFARPLRELVIEDFEQRAVCKAYWEFGAVRFTRTPTQEPGRSQALSVRGEGLTTVGHGFGLYLNDELGARSTFALDVRGYGARSGRIKIELIEDDNGNWDVEKDPRLFTPLFDDRFVFELPVDWTGWRHIRVPLALFVDDNPGQGNDRFDPERDLTSGGLLEVQLLFSPLGAGSHSVELDVDNLVFSP